MGGVEALEPENSAPKAPTPSSSAALGRPGCALRDVVVALVLPRGHLALEIAESLGDGAHAVHARPRARDLRRNAWLP